MSTLLFFPTRTKHQMVVTDLSLRAFLLPTEVATPSLREPTVSWAIFWSYATAIMTSFAVPQIISPDAGNLGAKAAFIFGGCVFLTIIWAWFYLPETKSRSVAEIDELYRSGVPMWRWKGYRCQCLDDSVSAGHLEKVEDDRQGRV